MLLKFQSHSVEQQFRPFPFGKYSAWWKLPDIELFYLIDVLHVGSTHAPTHARSERTNFWTMSSSSKMRYYVLSCEAVYFGPSQNTDCKIRHSRRCELKHEVSRHDPSIFFQRLLFSILKRSESQWWQSSRWQRVLGCYSLLTVLQTGFTAS